MQKNALVLLLVFLFVTALFVREFSARSAEQRAIANETRAYREVRELIEEHYVEEIGDDAGKLFYGAMRGMVGELDPHSQFLPPAAFTHMLGETGGHFGGLGILVTLEDEWLTVVTPLIGTPAYAQGVLAGDRIEQIEGESTRGLNPAAAVEKLRGEPGSTVTITVRHPDTGETEDITIRRAVIMVESIKFAHMADGESKIAYVKLTRFQKDTADRLREAVEKLEEDGMRALILDLRANRGGLLKQAIDVSNLFLSEGVIVSTRGRPGSNRISRAEATPFTRADLPMAVLIDPGSASASEIVAGALRDNGRAITVGEKSYGKGSVQTLYPVELDPAGGKQGALKLTTARFYAPSGKSIHGVGIEPDLPVAMTITEIRKAGRREQQEWIRRNQQKGDPMPDDLKDLPQPYWKGADKQIDAAVRYLNVFLRDGEAAAKSFVERRRAEVEATAKASAAAETPRATPDTGDRTGKSASSSGAPAPRPFPSDRIVPTK